MTYLQGPKDYLCELHTNAIFERTNRLLSVGKFQVMCFKKFKLFLENSFLIHSRFIISVSEYVFSLVVVVMVFLGIMSLGEGGQGFSPLLSLP